MIGRSSSFLGLAVADRTISCAELTISGGRRAVRRTATFALTGEMSLDNPGAVGQALASFLRQNRFAASRAVVGIPARWLMAVEKELPPADEDQGRAALRLQAERLAASESGELVFDYAGRVDFSIASRVLLVGTLRQRLDNVEAMMDAAGISVVAVTSTGLALASCAEKLSSDSSIVVLSRGGAEMIWRENGVPRALRHVTLNMNGHGTPPIAPLTAELRRAVALAGSNGQSSKDLMLFNGVGLARDEISQLAERMGVQFRPETGIDALRITREPSESDSIEEFAPAMALAVAGAEPELLPLDFRRSRLAPPQKKRINRRVAWAIALGAVALLAILALYASVHSQESELQTLSSQLDAIQPDVKAADATIDRVRYGRGFFDMRPPVLEALREITLSFRDDERIWVTSFTIRDNGKGQLIGKAADQRTVLAVLGRLSKHPRFSDVKFQDMRDADNRARETTFSMSFTFKPVE